MNIEEKIQENIDLSKRTSFRIGGPAKYYIDIKEKEDLVEAIKWANEKSLKIFYWGGGTNVLVSDKGIDGLVIKFSNIEIKVKGDRVECGAGASLMRASRMAASEKLKGFEWGIGIPGTIGGAVKGNAGAYGSYIGDYIETLQVYDINKERFFTMSRNDCHFSYKKSIFNSRSDLLVWDAVFKFEKGIIFEIDKLGEEYMLYRKKTQPNLPSAGCIFKNVSYDKVKIDNPELAKQIEIDHKKFVERGMVPVAWLLEELDLKGKVIGGAKISLEHANFIVNTGNASSEDVIILISYIKQQLRDKFHIQLSEEIQYLGF
ncbi:MAG: UDP-N-acetylmuramate dehydrogenase [Patescibacteria group bacterium]|jgi:UDP-N-acetylmuramate dehydrogenase|nr:UDP-N-acetylmuramate dehydrogenase [Patescibacteria group bacterium]